MTTTHGGPGDTTGRQKRLVLVLYTYDPTIYDITSGCKVVALFWHEALRWTPDAIWFPRITPTG